VILDRCADYLNEKVLRASEGAVYAPNVRTFVLKDRAQFDHVDVLQTAALTHRLLPIFGVPDARAEPVFKVAQRLHYCNRGKASDESLGAMVFLGSEAQGLEQLQERWAIPAKPTCITLDNAQVNSMNLAFAASILLHHFRPNAAGEFEDLFRRGVVPADQDEAVQEILRLTAGDDRVTA
jgi:tRNA G18 (ribose-2'-O)-methylase SpoU